MVTGDDLVYFLSRRFVQSPRSGLVVNLRDDIRIDPSIQGREIFVHRTERDVVLEILRIVVAMPDALQGADHFKPHAIQENGASNRGPTREQRSTHFVSQDDDTSGLYFIHLVEPTPVVDGDVADAAEIGPHPIDLAARLKVVADRTNVAARNDRSRASHAWTFQKNVFVIPNRQLILAQCREAALDHRGPSRPDEEHILPY